jgi:hypothetical protein
MDSMYSEETLEEVEDTLDYYDEEYGEDFQNNSKPKKTKFRDSFNDRD